MHIPFIKMSAAGNDFVLIDETKLGGVIENYNLFTQKVCNRRLGIGADGLLVYKSHNEVRFEMEYYNSDGSSGGMCGNGGRCISAYHFDVYGKGEPTVQFTAIGHVYTATTDGKTITVEMKNPTHLLTDLSINVDGVEIACNFIDTGSPHTVVFLDDLKNSFPDAAFEILDIHYLGSRIRHHEAFKPLGTNVNFVEPISDTEIRVRTYERGVEGETLACGTGAIASAVIAAKRFQCQPPIHVDTRSGEKLAVDFSVDTQNNAITNVTLAGTWMYHYTGSVFINEKENRAGLKQMPDFAVTALYSQIIQRDR